jgi:hypothetical protein
LKFLLGSSLVPSVAFAVVRPATDLACVIHVHSTYSDGTGTVAQIAAAGARAGVDVVLLTDHDSLDALNRGEERWYGPTLVCVGEEVSPRGGNHYLAFGLDREIDHRGLTPRQIVEAVVEAGGIGFLAHPFSRGSERFKRAGEGMPWQELDLDGYTGIELWSLVTDTGESLQSLREALRFIVSPRRVIEHPPRHNMAGWDRLTARRPVVAIGGVDAHQFGVRVAGHVPLRLMAYRRSFSHLRTHVLLERPLAGDAAQDRDAIYAALRAGHCYLAVDSLTPARGFAFWADGREQVPMGGEAQSGELELHVRLPRAAALTLLRDGEPIQRAAGTAALDRRVEHPGVYRVEATLRAHARERTWILSNPLYLR